MAGDTLTGTFQQLLLEPPLHTESGALAKVHPSLANITIRDVEGVDSITVRQIVLSQPNWSIKIGRGSLNGDESLRPAEDNAWFDSRVMSRNHAILRADPITRVSLHALALMIWP